MKKKFIIIIAVLVLVVCGAYLFNRYYLKGSTANIIEQSPIDDIKTAPETKQVEVTKTNEKIIYLRERDDAKDIFENTIAGDSEKLLFSDEDEDLKIQKVGALAYLSREIIYYSGGDISGNLVIADLNESKISETINNISNPTAFSISPDGQKIAYVVFSNVEANYGNNIVVASRNGENRRVVYNTENEIQSISFNPDSKTIAFAEKDSENKSKVSTSDLDSPKAEQIYTIDGNIPIISWSKNNKIILSVLKDKFTTSSIIVMDPKGKEKSDILDTKNGVATFVSMSQDGLNIGYVAKVLNDNFDANASGDVKAASNKGQNILKISTGSQVFGFLP